MKIEKKTFFSSGILIGLVIYCIAGSIYKENSEKKYAMAYIYDSRYYTGSFPTGLGRFYVNDKEYGTSISNGSKRLNKYFIVEFVVSSPRLCGIKIKTPINPNKIIPQPPDGWPECPINDDGTIKEKYRRKNGSGTREENNIKDTEHSTKESAPVTKETIESLKKNNFLE